MYAVVYKGRVIVGPMDWNRGIFQYSLEKEKIETLIPRVAPDELPLIVNDDAKIMIADENRPELNPMVQYYYGPLWDVSGEKAIANYEVVDTPIEFAKSNFKEQAAQERYKKEVSGTTININGTEIKVDTSREGRNIFSQRLATLADGESINWKFNEGWVTLSKQQLEDITASIASHIQSAFDWEKSINDAIDQCTTKEELLAIEIVSENN